MTLYNQLTINRRAENAARLRENALRAHERVGGNGASLKANPDYTQTIVDNIDTNKKGPGSAQLNNKLDRARATPTREVTADVRESWKQKKWGDMTPGEKFQGGASAALKILDTIDMLTGGQDKVLPGSGYAMSQGGYNPDMYIGQGMGY